MEFGEWGIVFHTLNTEQLVASLLNRYNAICTMIPDDKRASIHVNSSLLSHSAVADAAPRPDCRGKDRAAYIEGLRAYYAAMCDKHKTQRLVDIEEELADRIEQGSTRMVLDSARRSVDMKQCAAILETLQWDEWGRLPPLTSRWFDEVRVKSIQGQDDIVATLAGVLTTNTTLRVLSIDDVEASPKVEGRMEVESRHSSLSRSPCR